MTTRRGEAGFAGPGVRSDLHVEVESNPGGGVTLDLNSKVRPYYGEAIIRQIEQILDRFGVADVHLAIDDKGALPFTIEARIETALRRAGLVDVAHEATAEPSRPVSDRRRLRRSRLYLPGNDPKYMINAGLYGADAVILDLEDSVHPAEKDSARALVAAAIRHLDFGDAEVMVRINQSPVGLEDLEAVIPAAPDLILIPKVEHPDEVEAVDEAIADITQRLGWERPIWLMPIIESALGVESAFAIAIASDRNVALTIGLEDLTADLGVPTEAKKGATRYARERLVNAAVAARLQPIDSVYGDVGDSEGLEAWAAEARVLGFEGMGCVHPRQIPIVNDAFVPSASEIEKAEKVVHAFEKAREEGLAVVSLGSKMIDAPVVERALKIVDRARRLGILTDERSG